MPHQIIDVTCVQVDQLMIAIPSQDILTTINPKVNAIPSTVDWFEGMCIHADEIIPVYNLPVMSNPNTLSSKYTYLLIDKGRGDLAVIAITRLVTKFEMDAKDLIEHKKNGGIIADSLLGQLVSKNGSWLLLDINRLLSDPRIRDIEIA
jgi:chemotaxis signal transduction protein